MPELEKRVYTPHSNLRRPWHMIGDIAKDIRRGQDLAMRLTIRDIKAMYRQSALGFLWAFIIPIANTVTWIFLNATASYPSANPPDSLPRVRLHRHHDLGHVSGKHAVADQQDLPEQIGDRQGQLPPRSHHHVGHLPVPLQRRHQSNYPHRSPQHSWAMQAPTPSSSFPLPSSPSYWSAPPSASSSPLSPPSTPISAKDCPSSCSS